METKTNSIARNEIPHVIFESPASYHPSMIALFAIGPCSLIVVLVRLALTDELSVALPTILSAFVFVLILYSLLLPRGYKVLSNRSIHVVVISHTWKFEGVESAAVNNSICDDFRPMLKFLANYGKRVVVRRNTGWDLSLSPADPAGFVHAVNETKVPEGEDSDQPVV